MVTKGGHSCFRAAERLLEYTAIVDHKFITNTGVCLLYTSDAADERSSVDLGSRRNIKKNTKNKKQKQTTSK